mmetsp:Transcript_76593/g.212774  ORF Transcript_76593/g.212774 Transcript_76593/m.212774 type:complete len:264 (+) Transcript_76593:137-928(+)
MFEPGKWKCPNPACSVVNYKRNIKCFSCGAKPGASGWQDDDSSSEDCADKSPEEEWVCDFCGRRNTAKDTHCFLCTSPSDEFLERKREQKQKEQRRKQAERHRSSRSVEREKRKQEEEDKKARFKEAMSQDTKSMPCMPQKLGETRGSGMKIEGAPLLKLDRHREAGRGLQDKQSQEKERLRWDSDDEAYDEFGRRKRTQKGIDPDAKAGGARSQGSSLSAKQQAALERLQSKAKKPSNVIGGSAATGSTRAGSRSRSSRRYR